jgi:hypothetical protein
VGGAGEARSSSSTAGSTRRRSSGPCKPSSACTSDLSDTLPRWRR